MTLNNSSTLQKIGILTTSKAFDSHIAMFKKRGFNAQKFKIGDDISSCDTLILDLAYPLEQAFTMLEAMSLDYMFSECTIIVAISNKSEMAKLRASTLKMDGHISPEIDFQELIAKIRQCKDPELISGKKFDRVELDTEIEGKLTHISESGVLITCHASFIQGNLLSIRSSLIDDLAIKSDLIQKVSKSNVYQSRNFVSEIEFLNMTEDDRLKIRQMIHSWSIK